MFKVLYQDTQTLAVQTQSGRFDKWGEDLYGQFNMGLHVSDNPKRVLANRVQLLQQLHQLTDGQVHELYWLNQTHSDTVIAPTTRLTDADALITDKVGVGLAIMTADCIPIALFGGGQIACVHAGWQGLTKGIIASTAHQFTHKPIKAVIGSCISQANYEIDQTLAHTIVGNVVDKGLVGMSKDRLYQAIISDKADDKCLIDIIHLAQLQLQHLGITYIDTDVACSYDAPNLYSYRQQTHAGKRATGRMATVIVRLS